MLRAQKVNFNRRRQPSMTTRARLAFPADRDSSTCREAPPQAARIVCGQWRRARSDAIIA